jgi:hypothetical protein
MIGPVWRAGQNRQSRISIRRDRKIATSRLPFKPSLRRVARRLILKMSRRTGLHCGVTRIGRDGRADAKTCSIRAPKPKHRLAAPADRQLRHLSRRRPLSG